MHSRMAPPSGVVLEAIHDGPARASVSGFRDRRNQPQYQPHTLTPAVRTDVTWLDIVLYQLL